ncbi:MAG: hypothetical protein BGO83_04915 [Devosia sp. 66-14]|nr:MAG: hypothetical protein BGO83_04915 [Devosia sp. 66-14]
MSVRSLVAALDGFGMQFAVDFSAPRGLTGTVGRRQFRPTQVLIDHRQLGVQVVVAHYIGGDFDKPQALASFEPMHASDDLPTIPGNTHTDGVDQPDIGDALGQTDPGPAGTKLSA